MNTRPLSSHQPALHRKLSRLALWFALLLLFGRPAAAATDWAAGWTRCPSPSANWFHLAVSSDASVIAAIGTIYDEVSGLPNTIGAVSKDFGRTWSWISSLPDEVSWNNSPFSEKPFALSGDGSFMAIAGSQWSQGPDGTSVSEAVLMTADDHGTTWNRCELPPEIAQSPDGSPTVPEITHISLARDGRQMQVVVAGVACLSQDRGQTWKVVVQWDDGRISCVAVSADGKTFAVGGSGSDLDGRTEVRLLLSTDAAATWSRLNWPGAATPNSLTLRETGENGLSIVAEVPDPDRGDVRSLLVSNDRGQNWRNLTLSHAPSAFAVTPDGIQILSVPGFNRPWPGIDTPIPISFSADSGATWQDATLGWVPLVAMSEEGSVHVAAMDSGVILVNGVLFPPTVLDTRREGDLGLVGDRSVTLGITAAGGRLNYQWRRDGTPLTDSPSRTGTQSTELRLTSVSEAELGTYSVVVSNAEGFVEANVLTLKLDGPTIRNATQTGSVALVDGAPVKFQVEATGGLLSCQWRLNDVNLEDGPGRTGSRTRELALAAASPADLGIYSLLVSNAIGSVVTNVGELRMTLPKVIASQPNPGMAVVPSDSTRMQVQVEGGQIEVEWLLNGLPLERSGTWAGPGTNVLAFTNIQSSDLGQYSVRLRSPLGQTVAEVAQINAASWSRANVPVFAWNSVALSGTADWVVACAPDGVFASKDGGGVWEAWPVPGTDWTSVELGHQSGSVILGQGNSAYAPAQSTFGYRSADKGKTWTPWNQGENGDPDWRTTSVASSADGQTLLTTVEIPTSGPFGLPLKWGFLRLSRDGGRTWKTAELDDVFIAYGMGSATCSDDGRSMAAVRHDFFEGHSIKISLDAGVTWRSSHLPESFVRAVHISGDGQRLVAIAGERLYACDSSSLAWQKLPAPAANWVALTLSQDGQRIFAADYGSETGVGVIHQSDDGGQTWRWSGSPSANWTAIACSADGERAVGVSPQGIFLSPAAATSVVAAVPLRAAHDASGIHFTWQGKPHQTYRLLSTPSLDSAPWQSAGAAVADAEGRVTIAEPANGAQRFWQALEIGQ